jgi:hypothetical protein
MYKIQEFIFKKFFNFIFSFFLASEFCKTHPVFSSGPVRSDAGLPEEALPASV